MHVDKEYKSYTAEQMIRISAGAKGAYNEIIEAIGNMVGNINNSKKKINSVSPIKNGLINMLHEKYNWEKEHHLQVLKDNISGSSDGSKRKRGQGGGIDVFKEFVKNDFRFAIDDFGTGYSNYGYMRDRTFDIVKVDRSFVTDIDKLKDNYLMVSFIIKMAHEMGLHVCIEGVETKEELSCVKRLGADYIQGYYYGKPVCLQDFEEQHLKRFVLG